MYVKILIYPPYFRHSVACQRSGSALAATGLAAASTSFATARTPSAAAKTESIFSSSLCWLRLRFFVARGGGSLNGAATSTASVGVTGRAESPAAPSRTGARAGAGASRRIEFELGGEAAVPSSSAGEGAPGGAKGRWGQSISDGSQQMNRPRRWWCHHEE